MEFYINYKIVKSFITEYNVLIDFFNKSGKQDTTNFLIKRINKLYRKIKFC